MSNTQNVVALRGDLETQLAGARSGECVGPTPDRLRRAEDAGEDLVARGEGEARQWRVSPVLDDLKRKNTIDGLQHAAVIRLLRDYYLGHYGAPRTSSYGERMSKSTSVDSYEDTRLHHFREWQKACHAVSHPYWEEVHRWVHSTLTGNPRLSCEPMVRAYAPNLGSQTASARCGAVLAHYCLTLCEHYGMTHPMNQPRYRDELARLQDRFSAELERINREALSKQERA